MPAQPLSERAADLYGELMTLHGPANPAAQQRLRDLGRRSLDTYRPDQSRLGSTLTPGGFPLEFSVSQSGAGSALRVAVDTVTPSTGGLLGERLARAGEVTRRLFAEAQAPEPLTTRWAAAVAAVFPEERHRCPSCRFTLWHAFQAEATGPLTAKVYLNLRPCGQDRERAFRAAEEVLSGATDLARLRRLAARWLGDGRPDLLGLDVRGADHRFRMYVRPSDPIPLSGLIKLADEAGLDPGPLAAVLHRRFRMLTQLPARSMMVYLSDQKGQLELSVYFAPQILGADDQAVHQAVTATLTGLRLPTEAYRNTWERLAGPSHAGGRMHGMLGLAISRQGYRVNAYCSPARRLGAVNLAARVQPAADLAAS